MRVRRTLVWNSINLFVQLSHGSRSADPFAFAHTIQWLFGSTFDLLIQWMYVFDTIYCLLSIWAKNEGKKIWSHIYRERERERKRGRNLHRKLFTCVLIALDVFASRKYSYSVLNKFQKPTNSSGFRLRGVIWRQLYWKIAKKEK